MDRIGDKLLENASDDDDEKLVIEKDEVSLEGELEDEGLDIADVDDDGEDITEVDESMDEDGVVDEGGRAVALVKNALLPSDAIKVYGPVEAPPKVQVLPPLTEVATIQAAIASQALMQAISLA